MRKITNPRILKFIKNLSKAFVVGVLTATIVTAQQSGASELGVVSNATQASSGIDNINLQNGNVSLQVPLASLPPMAGGKLSYSLNAYYNSLNLKSSTKQFQGADADLTDCDGLYTVNTVFAESNPWKIGGRYEIEFRLANQDFDYFVIEDNGPCSNDEFEAMQHQYFRPVLKMPDGSEHEMRITAESNQPTYIGANTFLYNYYRRQGANPVPIAWGVRMYTVDGTYITAEYQPSGDYAIYLKDGTKITPSTGGGQRISDTNGNSILLGHETVGNYDFARDEHTSREIRWSDSTYGGHDATKVEYQSVGGSWQTVWAVWGQTTVKGKFYSRTAWDSSWLRGSECYYSAEYGDTFDVLREIVLPVTESGQPPQEYKFKYNSDTVSSVSDTHLLSCPGTPVTGTWDTSYGFGEISEIETPTGAKMYYEYKNDGIHKPFSTLGNPDNILKNNITEKRVFHDGVTDTWTYSINSTSGASVINPDGSKYEENYYTRDSLRAYQAGSLGLGGLTFRSVQSDRVMTEKRWTLLGGTLDSYGAGQKVGFNPVVDIEYTTLLDESNPTIRVKMSAKKFEYDYNGELTKTIEYDWIDLNAVTFTNGVPNGIPGSTAILRVIDNAYYNQAPNVSSPNAFQYRTVGSSGTIIIGKPQQIAIGDGTTVKSTAKFHYDGVDNTAPTKGNLTKVSAYDDAASQWITTTSTYSSRGNVLTQTDAKGVVTQNTYGSINGYSDLYPTQTVAAYGTPIARTMAQVCDFYTGKVVTSVDVDNNNLSSTVEYDILGRPVKAKTAVGTLLESWATVEYKDSARLVVSRADLETIGDGKKVSIQHFDQLGRVRLARMLENSAIQDPYDEVDGIKVETRYLTNSPNAYQLTSNPYRAANAVAASVEPTMGWTQTTSWSNGSKQEVETFSGAALPAAFGGSNTNTTGKVVTESLYNATTATDQAGKIRRSIVNALGQLIRIDEPDSSGQLGAINTPAQPTTYAYDTLGNLTTVNQGVQQRDFTYSSLSRLLTAQNPESGTISYIYDNNGNLTAKSQLRSGSYNVVTAYTYDALNRITQRAYTTPNGTPSSYQTTPIVTYTYDDPLIANSKGRLTKVSSLVSSTEYTEFDLLGRVKAHKQSTDGNDYTTGYAYNLSGALIEQTYPSGRVVKNTLDISGDLSLVQSKKNTAAGYWIYANSFTYNPAGAVTSMQLGNGNWESTTFNARMQPTQIALGTTPTATNLLKLNYGYGTTANNGNVQSQTITVPGLADPFVQTYAYDSLNRLSSAEETSNSLQTWKQAFTYDRYGNRNFDEVNTTTLTKACGTSPTFTVCAANRKVENPEILASNNRIKGDQDGDTVNDYLFDSAGNTTKDASSQQYIYDGENKMVQALDGSNNPLGTYYYDGDGKRVKKVVPNGETTVFVYDASGKMVAEYSTQLNPTPQVSYLTTDTLGSPRINTNENGAVIARHDYHPFGEEIAGLGGRTQGLDYQADDNRKQFTGYERDGESGLDFAEARYYHSQYGRFIVPDPLLMSGRLASPQTWNRFTYVLNNPLALVDPNGLYECTSQSQAECRAFRNNLASDRVKLEEIRSIYGPTSDEYVKAKKAIDSYGCESKNGNCIDEKGKAIVTGKDKKGREIYQKDTASNVKVSFGGSNPGLTSIPDTNKKTIYVTFAKDYGSNPGIIANEGLEIAAIQGFLKNGTNPSYFQIQFDGALIQSVYGELNAKSKLSKSFALFVNPVEGDSYGINTWEKSWETPDRETVRSKRKEAILKFLKEDKNYLLTPKSTRKYFK